jgi:hypothetical protein
MLYISEWTPKFDTEMICSHIASAGQKAYKLTIPVCRAHVACMPQALKAALKTEQQEAQKPSWLDRLWHKCFGTKPKQNSLNQGTYERMRKCVAKQEVHLDCGHTVKGGTPIWESRLYSCQRESQWPLAVLAACLFVLQREKAAPQPNPVKKTDTTKHVSPSINGYHQPHPNLSA